MAASKPDDLGDRRDGGRPSGGVERSRRAVGLLRTVRWSDRCHRLPASWSRWAARSS